MVLNSSLEENRYEWTMEPTTLYFTKCKQGVILTGNSMTGKGHLAKVMLLMELPTEFPLQQHYCRRDAHETLCRACRQQPGQPIKCFLTPGILPIEQVGSTAWWPHESRQLNAQNYQTHLHGSPDHSKSVSLLLKIQQLRLGQ